MKLSFGESTGKTDKPAVFKFSSSSAGETKGKDGKDSKPVGSLFSIGVSDSIDKQPQQQHRNKSPRRHPGQSSANKDGSDKSTEKGSLSAGGSSSSILTPQTPPKRQALSPAVAECQRAIFAAFLWQENLVHDAMAAAFHLKLHPDITKEMRLDIAKKERKASQGSKKEGNESDEEEEAGTGEPDEETFPSAANLPPTINHLVTFWDEIAVKVIDSSNSAFPQPKVPSLAQELQRPV